MAVKILSCVYGKTVIPQRYIFCFMGFLGVLMAYSLRACLHIAITKMVKEKERKQKVCPRDIENNNIDKKEALFNWTEKQQGIILSSFFPGYVLTHIPGGMLADKFGGKYIFSGGIEIAAIFSVLTPIATQYWDWWCLSIIRFIIGLAQGPVFPSLSNLLAKWAPPREQGTLVALVTTGAHVGTVTGNLVSSLLIEYQSWVTVFYFWGIVSLIWCILFSLFCYSDPAQHPFITADEALMLEEEIGIQDSFKIPWIKILTHPPIWALVCAEIAHDWLFFLAVVNLPTYVANIINVRIRDNGIINSIPYVALTVSSSISGVISDVIINTNKISVLNTRKIFTTFGNVCPGMCIVLMSYMGCNTTLVGLMFVLCMMTMGPFYAGMRVNALDVTKTFAGVSMGIVNGFGTIAFIPVPYLIALSTTNYTLEEWRLVFWVQFASSVIVNMGFLIWASSERAPWDINPTGL